MSPTFFFVELQTIDLGFALKNMAFSNGSSKHLAEWQSNANNIKKVITDKDGYYFEGRTFIYINYITQEGHLYSSVLFSLRLFSRI